MPVLPQDEIHLQRALDLAQAAVGLASPNPTVGCVLTSPTGQLLGEGAHHYDAFDHAEIAALKQAAALGHSVAGATAYITLEPCAHHGRTGPCSDALIAAGITRCVVAAIDPNPLTRNKGLAKLRDAGLTVDVAGRNSPQAKQARELNDAFAFAIQNQRPFVTLKSAVSLDGKIAPAPSTRSEVSPHWLTGPDARESVQPMRHASDVLFTGVGTVLADDPSLTDRSGLPRRRPLLRIIFDSALRTPLNAKALAGGNIALVCAEYASEDRGTALKAAGAEIWRLPTEANRPNIHLTLRKLYEELKMTSVLVEAGTGLTDALLQRNLVDRVVLYYADTELGTDAIPFSTRFPSPYKLQESLSEVTRSTFPHGDPIGTEDDVRITGYLHNPWAKV